MADVRRVKRASPPAPTSCLISGSIEIERNELSFTAVGGELDLTLVNLPMLPSGLKYRIELPYGYEWIQTDDVWTLRPQRLP